jgi:hypothetical protein
MSYSNCGYPNMTIKKFHEKYPSIEIAYDYLEEYYHIFIFDKPIKIRLLNLHINKRKIEYLIGMVGYWNDDFIDDIRLLYKYLLKEYKKREELKRKKEEDESTNQP